MDQKVKTTKTKKLTKGKIWIIILSAAIIIFGIFTLISLKSQQKAISDAQTVASDLQSDTAKIMRGTIANTLDDISGVVRSNQSVYLYWQVSGTVLDVPAEVGMKVKKGDVLAELDPGTVDETIVTAIVNKENAEEKMERLFTSTLELEQARTKMVEAKQTLKDAEDDRNTLGAVRTDLEELGIKYDDYQKSIKNYEKAVEEYDQVSSLDLDNPNRARALMNVQNQKSAMDAARSEYNWYNGEAEEADVQAADAAVRLAQSQLDDAVREYDRLKDGPTETQIRSTQAEIDSAQATINTAKIVAPIDGIIAQVETKPFDVITYDSATSERNILAVRIDDVTSHYIDVSVTELDIDNISMGQEVLITFDAIPFKEFNGIITNISNAGTVSNLSVNYDLTIRMENTDGDIKSGMMADAAIITEQSKDVLYVPTRALKINDAGETIITKIAADGSKTEIPVTTGLRDTKGNVEIKGDGFSEGDNVAVTKVTSFVRATNPFEAMMNGMRSFGSMTGNSSGGMGGARRPPAGAGRPPAGGPRP